MWTEFEWSDDVSVESRQVRRLVRKERYISNNEYAIKT